MSKECNQCHLSLPLDNFYKARNYCKKCFYNKKKCEHNIEKSKCRECKGSSLCIHDIQKAQCRECGGSSFCEHDIRRNICRECKGTSICEHDKIKNRCAECDGSQICVHKKIKNRCTECDGNQICEHKINKNFCKECKGSGICIHDKRKYICIICNPSCACIDCKSVFVDKRSSCYPLCKACFCNTYPDHEKSTLYKIKERYLRDDLRVRFPDKDINMIFDKAVDGGCSKKRPDVLIDLLLYSIIIECDEGQHKNYECENKRTMQLFEDLGNRPLIIIRFNPDGYTEGSSAENKNKIEGCFIPLITIEDIHKKKFYDINEKEWKRRIDILEEVVRGKIREEIPEKEVEEIKLFYDV